MNKIRSSTLKYIGTRNVTARRAIKINSQDVGYMSAMLQGVINNTGVPYTKWVNEYKLLDDLDSLAEFSPNIKQDVTDVSEAYKKLYAALGKMKESLRDAAENLDKMRQRNP